MERAIITITIIILIIGGVGAYDLFLWMCWGDDDE